MKFKKEYKNLNKFIKEFKSGLIWVNSEMIEKALELIKENLNDELYNIPCQVEYKSDWCYYKRGYQWDFRFKIRFLEKVKLNKIKEYKDYDLSTFYIYTTKSNLLYLGCIS